MFGRKKKRPAPQASVEPKPIIIFCEIVVSEMRVAFVHDDLEIYPDWSKSTIKNFCTSCGGDLRFDNSTPWHKIKSSSWTCGDCVWYRDKFDEKLTQISKAIEELEPLHEKLMDAFAGLLGQPPVGLESDDLRQAGLILHREHSDSVLGFILIDYSREQMHKLVTAVNGRLEPFSRGFKFFLPPNYYKLFPGSGDWNYYYGGIYHSYNHGSYLDTLKKQQQEIEAKAEPIRVRIAGHKANVSELSAS